MIRINLLPEEQRRKARTSLKVLGLFAAGATVNGLLLAWYGWLAFGVAAEIEGERAVLQTEMDGISPQVEYHKSLDGEKKRFAGREEALAKITKTRILWTKKLDQLITVVNSGGDGKRHLIWLDDLVVVQNSDSKAAKSAGSLKAQGHSGSALFEHVANFLEDLERSPFLEDFLPPSPPEGTQSQQDPDLVPAVVWNFPLKLELKSKEPPKPDAAKKPAPAKQPAAQEAQK
jgi:Tfp pilus assembly protein PilN